MNKPATKYNKFFRYLLSTGYRVKNEKLYRVWNIFAAVQITVLSMPFFILIPLALYFTQGRPIFYEGERLGRNAKPFQMYKFRTLRPDAATRTSRQVLGTRSGLETPLGKVLRETRIDELPQLFNVLKGEMNLVGPRPVRAELAAMLGAQLPNYDQRFAVKPGLFGLTQAYMTHRSPKRLRALYNSVLLRRKAQIWKEPLLIAYIAWRLAARAWRLGKDRLVIAQIRNRRHVRRAKPREAVVHLIANGNAIVCGSLRDINDQAFTFNSAHEIDGGTHLFRLSQFVRYRGRSISALCEGMVMHSHPNVINGRHWQAPKVSPNGQYRYVIRFSPTTDYNVYKIERYFMEESILR